MIALTIEGLEGAYGFGEISSAPSGYIARSAALVTAPRGAKDYLDPRSYRLTAGRVQVVLNAKPQTRLELLYQAPYGSAVATLQAPLATSGLINLGVAGLDFTVVYIDRETISLGADVGSGVYTNSRALYGSIAAPHQQGAYVYTSPPFFEGRSAQLWRLQDGAWSQLWQGYIAEPPKTTADLTQIQVSLRSTAEQAERKLINRSARASEWTGFVCASYASTTHKAGSAWDQGVRACIIGESLMVVQRVGIGARVYPGTTAQLQSPPYDPGTPQRGAEVLLVSRELDAAGLPTSPTAQLPHPYHPVTLACALLFSTGATEEDLAAFDVLSPSWSAGMRHATSSALLGEIAALIERTAEVKVEQLLIGAEGAERVIEVVRDRLLLPYGFALVSTAQGLLTIRQIAQIDVGDALAEVQAIDTVATWQAPHHSAAVQIVAEVGALPWQAAASVSLTARGAGAQDEDAIDTQRIILSTQRAERAASLARTGLLSALMLRQQGWPTIELRCNALPAGLALLDKVQPLSPVGLASEPFITSDKQLTGDLNQLDFAGLVVGIQRFYERAFSYAVTILLTNYPLRGALKWRAPSAKITAVSVDGLTLTIAVNGGLGSISADIEEWEGLEGLSVEIADASGAYTGTDFRSIASIDTGANQIVMSSAFLSDPVPGQWVRLTRYEDFVQDPRLYVFFAGAGGLTLSEADQYG